ncbi:glycosyltransferase [Polaribacter sp.]|uniref:glycosyltransferase n=1 Tax=Polaribacter sp. TaxID=1920175 RepID=UPI00404771F6
MKQKNHILIISPFFYPEPISTGKFNTDFALELVKAGHSITVLCFHPLYPGWKVKPTNQKLEPINIIRGGKHLKFPKNTILKRLVLEISYAFFVFRKIVRYQKKIDIIIPIFPPSLAFYSILPFLPKKIQKVGMVHDLQEVYSFGKAGFLHKIVRFFIHGIEEKCYRQCDRILFLSKEMKNEAKRLYNLRPDKLLIQYPFINISSSITNDLDSILKSNKINIVYSGALGEKQNPYDLYRFFDQASKKIENTVFHFFSRGEIFNDLKNANKNLEIYFHPLVKKENLSELYKKSDVQIIPQKVNSSKGSLPSKLPNLLYSGCKILIVTDPGSEIETLFEENNIHFTINSWDLELLIESLEKAIQTEIDEKHQKDFAQKFFSKDQMVKKVLNKVISY